MTDGLREPATLGIGCVRLGHPSSGGRRAGVRLVHRALDLGVLYFDTADSYGGGSSEQVLGHALAGRRDTAVIATKAGYLFRERSRADQALRRAGRPLLERLRRSGGARGALFRNASSTAYANQDFSVAHLRSALEASLHRLRTDHVDLYQLHGPPGVCGDDVLALMSELTAEGKIRGFGVGLESLDHALEWARLGSLAGLQIAFGVLDPEAGVSVIPTAVTNSVPVIARGAFASGLLARESDGDAAWLRPGQAERRAAVYATAGDLGVDPLQLATWFVTTTPGVRTLLVGTTSEEHLQQVVSFAETPPPRGVATWLDRFSRAGAADADRPATGQQR